MAVVWRGKMLSLTITPAKIIFAIAGMSDESIVTLEITPFCLPLARYYPEIKNRLVGGCFLFKIYFVAKIYCANLLYGKVKIEIKERNNRCYFCSLAFISIFPPLTCVKFDLSTPPYTTKSGYFCMVSM